MRVGVLVLHGFGNQTEESISQVKKLGFDNFQLASWDSSLWTDFEAEKIIRCCEQYGVEISTFWCGWGGPQCWNLYDGPETLGFVPITYRYLRFEEFKKGSDFAKKLSVQNVATHVGFIPECPHDPIYLSLIPLLRELSLYLKGNNQNFLFETGQETPVTLLRTIEDIGTDNLGINLDPANFIMYGKANPVDAVGIIGKYIKNVHGKDGNYPINGRELGCETPMGEGMVNYPEFIRALKRAGYDGPITIEREISGEQQIKDIVASAEMLRKLIAEIE